MAGTLYQQRLVSPRPWRSEDHYIYDADGKMIANMLEGWCSDYDAAFASGWNEAKAAADAALKEADDDS